MNSEGYKDPTAEYAVGHLIREERREVEHDVHRLIHMLRETADREGFEIVGRVVFKHKESGKVFR